ncbi:hypothetical protein V565_058230 [Rhizoctonia solani 123E]|uniref:Uncharacterized protein n=1 Tax=Rhizoctonia solani 123E TaxID=1423351 RepID=A0A074RXE3_9AGAM|nr:hypothetical protein V565_058230 [Rhizoctonia solani 123E]
MSPANPLSRLSAIIRAPLMTHTTDSDWFLPYDGPVEPPPPPIRHPFAAAEIAQPRASRPPASRPVESRSRANSKSDGKSRSRSRSVDTKRKSQRSFVTLDQKGGVGAYPAPDSDREYASDHTFGTHSGHVRGKSSIGKQSFPWSEDSTSTDGKRSDPPPIVFENHPFRMHTTSPPPRTHTASTPLTTTTPWVRAITASPAPPDPAPMRKRTMTYQPGLVTAFGSSPESRVGYRESGTFVALDDRERERIRPTLLPPSLSLLGKGSNSEQVADEHGQIQKPHANKDRELYPGLDLRSHPYALQSAPVRETRFGSYSTTATNTTGGSAKPLVPPRPSGSKLKSSLKASMSTPELRIHIPPMVPPSGLSAGQTPSTDHPQSHLGLGARPRHPASSVAANSTAANTTLEARSICDALIFARPRFRVASHEITPSITPHDDEAAKRASMRVGEGGLKGLVCFPRKASRDFSKDKGKGKEKEKEPREFQTLEQVLKEGAQLEKERREWNAIGQGSLFNSRARSLSRSQTKIGNGPRGKRSVSVSVSESGGGGGGTKVWGTIKIKRSVEMLAASAFSQGHGPAPSVTSSKRTGGHGAQASVSTTSHARHTSGSVASRGHSRNGSWGQRVVCGSHSGSSQSDETPGAAHHSSEGLVSKRAPVDSYPVVDIRPVPVGNTNRARAPPTQGSVGFSFGTRRTPNTSPSKTQKRTTPSPGPGLGDTESVIGLALSSPSGTSTPLVLPNHPFAQRAGAYPIDPAPPPPPGPETIATRHRHPPRSSGSTERARLDDSKHTLPGPSKYEQHPFVARMSTHSGEVQRMFESAMLKSAGGQGEFAFNARRGSGDSGLGSSVHELAGPSSPPFRGSAFGPPAGLEAMLERAPAPTPIPESQPVSSPKAASPQSPYSLMGSLSPVSGIITRMSSGMIDPCLMSPQSRSHSHSHESTSSSFSSPRIDDIESLRDIFYRPSPDRRAGSFAHHSQEGSTANEPVLAEEDEEEEEEEPQERNEDWTFGRRPFELGSDSHLIWRRRREDDANGPSRIHLAPGTPSPPLPRTMQDSDSRSERSVKTTSSHQVSNENVTFGVVPSARMDTLSVNIVSPRQSAALSLIDMYDYEASLSSSSPNTPQNFQSLPSPTAAEYPRESYYTTSSSGVRHLISGFPTPPMDASVTPLSASVLSSYFTVDTHTSSRRETD